MVWILFILIIQEKCIFKIAYDQRQVNTVPHLIFTQASPALQTWRLGHLGLKIRFTGGPSKTAFSSSMGSLYLNLEEVFALRNKRPRNTQIL